MKRMRPDYLNYADLIKESVPMESVVRLLFPTNRIRHHRTQCPFHGGKDYNLRIYPDSYYCFVCHASGDVIRFMQDAEGLSFVDACKTLNGQFGLGLFEQSEADRKRIEQEQKRKRTERMLQQYDVSLRERRLETLKDIERLTDLIVQESAPQAPWEDYTDVWCEAIRLREMVSQEIERMEDDRSNRVHRYIQT